MYKRDTIEYQSKQLKNIEMLVNEAINGVTKMDKLDNSGRALFCPEAEAMYFNAIRTFFENSISKRVMDYNQDNSETKVLKMTNSK